MAKKLNKITQIKSNKLPRVKKREKLDRRGRDNYSNYGRSCSRQEVAVWSSNFLPGTVTFKSHLLSGAALSWNYFLSKEAMSTAYFLSAVAVIKSHFLFVAALSMALRREKAQVSRLRSSYRKQEVDEVVYRVGGRRGGGGIKE